MNQELENKIERYLDGQLPDADHIAFEKEIAANSALARDVETSKLSRVALDMLFKDSKSTMNAWHVGLPDIDDIKDDDKKSLKVVWYRRRDFLAVAASVALAVSVWFGFNIHQSSNDKVVAAFVSVPTLEDNSAGASPDDSTAFESEMAKGLKAFKAINYAQAAQYFRNELTAKTNPFGQNARRSTQINLAHALFQAKKYGEAATLFRTAQQTNDALEPLPSDVLKEIKWFEILSLVGDNQIDEAKKQLAKGLENPNYKALNEKLNSFWRRF